MTVPFMYNFRSRSNKFPIRFCNEFNFAFQSPSQAIFRRKRKPKIVGFENAMERRIRKILISVKLKIASKIFGKIIPKPLQFRKDSSCPRTTEPDTSFIAPLRMHFQRSKSTLDSLKSVFNTFRRKPSLGAPEELCHKIYQHSNSWKPATKLSET